MALSKMRRKEPGRQGGPGQREGGRWWASHLARSESIDPHRILALVVGKRTTGDADEAAERVLDRSVVRRTPPIVLALAFHRGERRRALSLRQRSEREADENASERLPHVV